MRCDGDTSRQHGIRGPQAPPPSPQERRSASIFWQSASKILLEQLFADAKPANTKTGAKLSLGLGDKANETNPYTTVYLSIPPATFSQIQILLLRCASKDQRRKISSGAAPKPELPTGRSVTTGTLSSRSNVPQNSISLPCYIPMAWKRDATYLLTVCNHRNGLAEAKYYIK